MIVEPFIIKCLENSLIQNLVLRQPVKTQLLLRKKRTSLLGSYCHFCACSASVGPRRRSRLDTPDAWLAFPLLLLAGYPFLLALPFIFAPAYNNLSSARLWRHSTLTCGLATFFFQSNKLLV